jgi:hypothetical protein
MRVGIIGREFGKRIQDALQGYVDVVFFTGKEMAIDYDVDWVCIATPNDTHYRIAKDFLERGVNVFLEKPPTLSYQQTKELIELAKSKGVKFYVDDVFLFNEIFHVNYQNFVDAKSITFTWKKWGSFKDNIFNTLTYHDLYLLIYIFGERELTDIQFVTNRVNEKVFTAKYGDVSVTFEYNRLTKEGGAKTITTESGIVNLSLAKNNALSEMLTHLMMEYDNVEFDFINKTTLHAQKMLDLLNTYQPKVAVVGAGIFGLTAALELDAKGFNVEVFEKEKDILQCASGINQYRLHRGYHYPRSKETAQSAKNGIESFVKTYDCLSSDTIETYYGVSKNNSFITGKQFVEFMRDMGLAYSQATLDILNQSELDLLVRVDERLFDPAKLRSILESKISDANLKLQTNYTFKKDSIKDFDYVVDCAYAELNCILDEKEQCNFQFELCEKPVVRMPDSYKNKSIVILDGPFMCIDPLGDTEYHLMGNVKHAIHYENVGNFPSTLKLYRGLMNRGIIKNPSFTYIQKFIDSAKTFFKDVDKLEHIGSMFTFRTVLPRREHDDARPSIVKRHNEKVFSIFSGKIPTCVDSSNELVKMMLES